jgi:predicted TIM-barrel fold metal-dependent hydrolase
MLLTLRAERLVRHFVARTAYAESPLATGLVWTLRQVGIDHILFGSNWSVYKPAEAVAAVRRLGLTQTEQRQVMCENAQKLLGLNEHRSSQNL